MDIGNKIPAPSLCFLTLPPKEIKGLLTMSLFANLPVCGITFMNCFCCAVEKQQMLGCSVVTVFVAALP